MTRTRRLLGLVVSSVAIGAIGVAPAQAADRPIELIEGPSAVASLHSMTPGALRASDTSLTFSGTVTNNGDEVLQNVRVFPRYSNVPLESRADIGAVDDPELRPGRRAGEPFAEVAAQLEPGQTLPFELSIPTDTFDFADAGVYVVGVDVRGDPPDGTRTTFDTRRTVVPWLPDDVTLPQVPVSLLWPVTGRPSLLPSGLFFDDSMAAQVASGGPLDNVLRAVAGATVPVPVSWMVDPDVLRTIDAMSDGYSVLTPDGEIEGTGAFDAAAWRAEFDATTRDADVSVLPFARPDLEALAEADPAQAATFAQESAASASVVADTFATSARDGIGWPDGPGTSTGALSALAAAGTDTVVLRGGTVEPSATGHEARIAAGDDELDAIVTDPGLDAAIAGIADAPDAAAGALALRQRWLAETAMVALEAPAGEPVPALVAAPPLRWKPDAAEAKAVIDALTSATWITPTALGDRVAPVGPVDVTLNDAVDSDPLPAANVAATLDLDAQASHFTSLLAGDDSSAAGLNGSALRAVSSGWRDDPAAGEAFAGSVTAQITDRIDRVSVTVPETVTLSSRQGVFPLTVTNDLDQAVDVRLEVTSDNADRLEIVGNSEVQRVEAGEKASVTVTARASNNGKVPVNIQLVASDGAPIGDPQRTVVNATDYGTLGWIIVAAAAGLFVAAMIRRMIVGRRETPVTDDEVPPPAGDTADTTDADTTETAVVPDGPGGPGGPTARAGR